MLLSQIKPNLFVGNVFSLNRLTLKSNNITHVISLIEIPSQIQKKNPEISFQTFPFPDDPTVDLISMCQKIYPDLLARLENGTVSVCCNAGKSRSVSVIIYYLIVNDALNFNQAYSLVCERHPAACLNRGFYQQLSNFTSYLSQLNQLG